MSESEQTTVYIGLGSNLENPRQQVIDALDELNGLEECHVLRCSSLYRTRPVGPQDQPDFINAVAALTTRLEPHALLDALQAIEQRHGRVCSGEHWGPRTLDLDLLLYGEQQIDTSRLQVPHPEMTRRAFVLVPLREIAEEALSIPGAGQLKDFLSDVHMDRLR
ncbi:MAG: 2-amino-4-hydroxy-6-hydroxymethyldihydropteridine diphosphokinase [Candidatus Thiodiazotropha sp.]